MKKATPAGVLVFWCIRIFNSLRKCTPWCVSGAFYTFKHLSPHLLTIKKSFLIRGIICFCDWLSWVHTLLSNVERAHAHYRALIWSHYLRRGGRFGGTFYKLTTINWLKSYTRRAQLAVSQTRLNSKHLTV